MKPVVFTTLVLVACVKPFVDGLSSHKSEDEGSDDTQIGPTCYVCTWSDNDDPCGDANFTLEPEQHGHYMVNCKVCYKKIMYNSTGYKRGILRGCVLDEWVYITKCQYMYFEGGLYQEVCACDTDYCNTASRTYGDVAMFWTIAVAVGAYVLARNRDGEFP